MFRNNSYEGRMLRSETVWVILGDWIIDDGNSIWQGDILITMKKMKKRFDVPYNIPQILWMAFDINKYEIAIFDSAK